jgi:hypothetical protein
MAIRTDFTAGEVLAAADLNDTFLSKLPIAGGKVLQIVRATDATQRTTTSGTYVDANISVTITPQKSDSAILLLNFLRVQPQTNGYMNLRIADASNNAIAGCEDSAVGDGAGSNVAYAITLSAYATPATTSAVTYKLRFLAGAGTATIFNQFQTGQMYAIEVSA